jgi:hypothetical protein
MARGGTIERKPRDCELRPRKALANKNEFSIAGLPIKTPEINPWIRQRPAESGGPRSAIPSSDETVERRDSTSE